MFNYAETLYELASMRQRELIMEAEQQRVLRAAQRARSNKRKERSRSPSTLAACGSHETALAR
jgi:hypothetical protein